MARLVEWLHDMASNREIVTCTEDKYIRPLCSTKGYPDVHSDSTTTLLDTAQYHHIQKVIDLEDELGQDLKIIGSPCKPDKPWKTYKMSGYDRRDQYEKDKHREERDDRRLREPAYEDVHFDKYKTQNVRKQYSEYYPRRNDSRQLINQLETERSLVSQPDSRRQMDEAARDYVTRDNKDAHRDRREAHVSTKDMAYNRDHALYDGYKTYKAKRDTQPREQGSGSKELPRR